MVGPITRSESKKIGYISVTSPIDLDEIKKITTLAKLQTFSSTTQAMGTAAGGTVIVFESAPIFQENILIDPITGIITFLNNESYRFFLGLNLDRLSQSPDVEIWLESFHISTLSWVIVPNSGRLKEYSNSVEFYSVIELPLLVDVLVAAKYRIKIRIKTGTGTGQLLATTITNGTNVPSATLGIYK